MSIAWLFPGQGSQAVGMARDVFEASPAARSVLARADAALAPLPTAPKPLSRLILEGPEDELTLTANAQPALVVASMALLAALRERSPDLPAPAFAAGHSLGEYSALVATEALSLEDAVRLVHARGRAMQDAVPAGVGAMSAVMGIPQDRLVALCAEAAGGEVVAPANFNGGQIVVAGHAGAVERLGALVSAEKGARVIPLKVSAPFHCSLMAPAAAVVAGELERVGVNPPRIPVVANVDAQPNADPARIKDLLVRQIDSPVRWEETVRLLAERGVTHALEIGPGKALAGLVKRIAKEIKVLTVGDMTSIDAAAAFLAEAAAPQTPG
jgi:[acyl-carrier-protein] S-malonyltransferase